MKDEASCTHPVAPTSRSAVSSLLETTGLEVGATLISCVEWPASEQQLL